MSNKAKFDNPFKATLYGILDLFKKQIPIGKLRDDERLDGKTCMVTGANSGLGYAIAVQMAQLGAHVIMACRSGIPNAGEQAKSDSGSNNIEMMSVDLSDLESIDRFVEQLKIKKITLDICVFNAAVVPSGSYKTKSGFDQMFLVNYLSTFKLANALINNAIIKKNEGNAPRIIFVSSESHRTNQEINFDNFGIYEEYTMSKVIALYGYYKLMLTTFAIELSKRINTSDVQISVFALCPGPVNSNIAKAAPKIFMPLLKFIFNIFFKDPKDAAEPVMYLACSKSLQNKTSLYLHLMQEKSVNIKALNPENGRKLWEASEKLITNY
jgi:NAD(P)-dependent dehydrogenase (short-subunit alcohol dehydrogenase family)